MAAGSSGGFLLSLSLWNEAVHGGAETKKALRTGLVRRALQPVLREQGYSSPSPPAELSFLAFLRRSQMCMSFIF